MTVSDLFRLAVHHRLVSLVALVCMALGGWWSTQQHVAYNGEVTVILLAPEATDDNVLAGTISTLVATAGIVAGKVNGPSTPPQTVASVTLASIGVPEGWSVRQPSNGGQWVVHYGDSLLDIRSTGPTYEAAQQQMQTALTRVDTTLAELQDQAGVPSDHRIVTFLNPATPVYTVQSGSTVRTLAAVLLLTLLGWAAALLAAERYRPRLASTPAIAPVA